MGLADRYEELTDLLSQPEIINDVKKFRSISKEHSDLSEIAEIYSNLKKIEQELKENQTIIADPIEDAEIKLLAQEESTELKAKEETLINRVKILLLPKDHKDEKNVILEIRAGTGGDEASLFVTNLYKMYTKFALINRWKTEVMSSHTTNLGGFKEIVLSIEGNNVYSRLKYEAGTHRVQRVPSTETQGRVHTSAVTVAILVTADDLEININPSDLRIDTYRSQGAGGQHVNTTDSAIRITHIPTGVVAACQEERSQIKNRNKAMKYLQTKLYDMQIQDVQNKEAALRKGMVGSGDRSERIRTYNYPQGRITDHRINLTLYKLDEIMGNGDLNNVIDSLATHEQTEKLKAYQLNS